ncbi:hypothetical protein [Dongia sp.]|uniref:hypothetical protein n=1 Tax=Dongia sp. TaxID=1977262 RepID=UPI0035AE1A43
MTLIETLSRGLLPWNWAWLHAKSQQKPVDFSRLSKHMLRDLGMSHRDAQDLVAAERARFL